MTVEACGMATSSVDRPLIRGPAPSVPRVEGERLIFPDVLRVAIVAMVIVHHAAQAYGPTGGVWPVEDEVTSDWFLPFYTANAAVGLGLLFLLAGYFTGHSYDRKGIERFLRERWGRIGVPLVVFVLGVHLPLAYLVEGTARTR
jgi:peptidoglycan/LPS O-acetylase OafA/YrhL